MPLFMDLHKASDYQVKPTIEEIKRNHIADLRTQAKYGVRFIQYWINEEAGLVFCMMEAPDKESCIATHREAHGDMPCNVIELKGGDYQVFMGDGNVNAFDITETLDGRFDPGHRSILVAEIITPPNLARPYTIFKDTVHKFHGRKASYHAGRYRVVFNKSSQAIACARALHEEFVQFKTLNTEMRIGVSSGMPVTEHDSLFADAVQSADCLCSVAADGRVSICSETLTSSKMMLSEACFDRDIFKVIIPSDQKLLINFMATVDAALASNEISLDKLTKALGISKAQLYRKIKTLSGHSPNALIQEIRLKNAYWLISQRSGNIAEIAFASGFNSPSYFSKSFQKRFGNLPAHVLRSLQTAASDA